jgi:hypothetical protein
MIAPGDLDQRAEAYRRATKTIGRKLSAHRGSWFRSALKL